MTEKEAIKFLDITSINSKDDRIGHLQREMFDVAINALEEIQQYRAIGTIEECRKAAEKQKGKKPIYRHYEENGEKPYIKITCPNGCRIQLYPVTEKHFAHEHNYCPKCGQAIDWSETGGQR